MTKPSRSRSATLATRLHNVDASAARASRLLHDRRFGVALRGVLPLHEPFDIGACTAPSPRRAFVLRLTGEAGELLLSWAPGDDAALSLLADPALAEGLRALAHEAVFGEILRAVADAGLPALRVEAVSLDTSKPGTGDGWLVLRQAGDEIGRLRVQSVSPALQTALQGLVSTVPPPAPRAAWRERVSLQGRVLLGTRVVAIDALQTLEPGDVLLLPAGAASLPEAPGLLLFGGSSSPVWCGKGLVQHGMFTVTGEFNMTMDDRDVAVAEGLDAPPDKIGALELPVRFEIQTVPIPLSDLASIEPGYVVELTTPVAEARLRLVACGQVIGHAELVVVGDRLGARIIRMVARDESELAS